VSGYADRLDQLGLVSARPFTHRLLFGQTDAQLAMRSTSVSHRMNAMPEARITLDPRLLPAEPIDYLAPIFILAQGLENTRPMFAGSVIRAEVNSPAVIEIQALGGRTLAEATSPALQTSGVRPPEIVYLLARLAGMGREQISISELGLRTELCEIVVPVDGLRVEERIEIGKTTFIGPPSFDGFSDRHRREFPDFFGATTYAVAYESASLLIDAETAALESIDLALAWIVTRFRYGLAVSPQGDLREFDRERAIATPRIRDVVFARSLSTQRRWLRSLTSGGLSGPVPIGGPDDPERLLPALPLKPDEKTEQAIRSLYRATRERDPLARVFAIWETVEFYVGAHKSPLMFSPSDKKAIKRSLPDSLCPQQRARAIKVIDDMFNTAPLRQKLEEVLDDEGVPWSRGDMDDLWSLRNMRNHAQHGKGRGDASDDRIMQALSFVSRMLVVRVKRIAARQGIT
jgi:hypothetical protein